METSNIKKDIRIKELNEIISEAEAKIQREKNLKTLIKMDEFQDVIIDGYMGELAEFLFNELTKSITFESMPEDQLKEGLLAIRHLKSYIGFDGLKGDIEYNAEKARDQLKDAEDDLFKLEG